MKQLAQTKDLMEYLQAIGSKVIGSKELKNPG